MQSEYDRVVAELQTAISEYGVLLAAKKETDDEVAVLKRRLEESEQQRDSMEKQLKQKQPAVSR